MKQAICTNCGGNHYQTFCTLKKRKAIKQKGRGTIAYEIWRDLVAIPYLDNKYGHVCSKEGCNEHNYLDVDHIKKRGSHPQLKMVLSNVRYLCRKHHREIT